MALPLEREEIQLLTEELEVIIAAHLAWFKQINRTLVCANPVNKADLADDAHLRSPFGQWYYSQRTQPAAREPGFPGARRHPAKHA
jgi:diguanylate cyclase